MPEANDVIPWDFLTLVDSWNLYGLPALLVVAVIAALMGSRYRPVATFWQVDSRTVFLVGLIHCALAFRAWISLAQELLTLRVMGVPQSFVTPVGAVFSSIVNPIVSVGLLCRRSWARRLAIGWYVILSLLAILVATWLIYYRVSVDPASWPEQVVSKVLPLYLLVVMFLPRIKRVFSARSGGESPPAEASGHEGLPPPPLARAGWTRLSLLTLMFLIVMCSNLVVDAVDWGYRLIFESEAIP